MNLTDKVGGRYKEPRVGIELEFEGVVGAHPLEWWDVVRDPSLRNHGAELVSIPLTEDLLPKALEDAEEWVQAIEPRATLRCGCHIHLNVAHITWKDLWVLNSIYLLLEPHIFSNFAPNRLDNHFCTPNYLNTQLVEYLYNDIQLLRKGVGRMHDLNILRCPKYAALNYAPLLNQRTVEFRMFPGTRDMDMVATWVRFVLDLEASVALYATPEDVVHHYETVGPSQFATAFGLRMLNTTAEYDLQDAEVAANLVCGYEPVKWQELQWDIGGIA